MEWRQSWSLVLFMSPWLAAGMLDVYSWTHPVHGQFVDIGRSLSRTWSVTSAQIILLPPM